ncbi:PREDICTED: prolactin-releasing peptide receptor-like [Gavialis gangeticus]|uniref:prolactin-releasing peptide receptor-like n=1 Tax=Gavialis gangeticus TaxID=94835 RepID=UPI00092F3698|nr:PREDICTED: prolactin-releasing peptide receptor-like [Gavialis gangeticus]XP_019370023.1 PREDICTED: prolactin-releasing peptide receptor-like [Gavialis gangeticus]XP_019370024.1 PREDICTED: prolactin-releasing peptide receptor-like [Gavialis gangeticus]XP_019370025.1 PREDICTED: prolactin-releasing peptide receptor-like [Gavialis gangeticus]XP_019370026.1 PREDICTED: prolactin-releasing peptide receptor-like [Gavialis gangeticus]
MEPIKNWDSVPGNDSIYEIILKNSSNSSSQFTGVQLIQSFKPLIIPCYTLVVLIGIFGNYLLLYVICKTKKMHNVTNFFIGNLAFSDMLMCATCVPFTLAYAFNPQGWIFGKFLCYFVFLMQPMTVYVSVFTLTAIAVDRYYATVHPLKKRISVTSCVYVVGGIWLLSCALVAPAIAHTYHVEFQREGFTICEEFWMEEEKEHLAYAYSTLIITYILPLSAVSLSYICITVKLKNRVVPGHPTQSQAEFERARKRKIFRLLVLVVAAFGICWLPIHVFNILRDIDINLINKHYFLLIQLLCHWFAMSSSCCNPFLYAWLHDRFRSELKKMFTFKQKIIPTNHCVAMSVML